MMNTISKMAEASLNAKTLDEQMHFIEYVEDLLMKDDFSLIVDEIQTCFNVLNKYIIEENKNLIQRSMKIVETMCQCIEKPLFLDNYSKIKNTQQMFKNAFKYLNDDRPNIRERSVQTIKSLINVTGFKIFCQNTSDYGASFNADGQKEIIKLLKQHQDDMSDDEWNCVFNFLVQIHDNRTLIQKNNAQDLFKHEKFLNQLHLNISKLTQSQQKNFQTVLAKKNSIVDVVTQNCFNSISKQFDDNNPDGLNPKDKNEEVISINTSAFSRKQRQKKIKNTDGLFLITDVSTFGPFIHQLSLDIRDVFDDEISELLLSHQCTVRVLGVNRLRDIFITSLKNFEYSVDIIIRWCLIQFLGWQLTISQAALSLLTDMFDCCINNEKLKLTTKEVHIITPIIIWCMTNQSDAFKYLLQQIKQLSNEKDYNESLIMTFSLDHIPVITQIFEELRQSQSLFEIKDQLEELSHESTISIVRDECKKLVLKLAPLSPRKMQLMSDPVNRLQYYITQIKTNPDEMENGKEIFGFILDLFDRKIKDPRETRYLLYCTHSFLLEPCLVYQINMNEFTTLVSLLCEFSKECRLEFFDALVTIGFLISSVHINISIFDALINFISRNLETQNKKSFSYQIFLIGIQMLSVNQNSIDLFQLKSFAKSVIGCYPAKDDIRAKLCRILLSEILLVEKHMKSEDGSFIQLGKNNFKKSTTKIKEGDSQQKSSSVVNKSCDDDLFEFLRILRRLTRTETRSESIRELLNFDDKFPKEKIVETIIKLSPLLEKHVEEIKFRSFTKASSRTLYRSSSRSDNNMKETIKADGNNGSHPSSRISKRRSSLDQDGKHSSKKRIPFSSLTNKQ